VSNLAIVALCVLMFLVGGGSGWYGRGIADGSTVSATDAAASSQGAVNAGVKADRAIVAGRTETQTAVERVRTITRTVEVAASCPPGRGPVSTDFAEQLRALAQARANASAGASRVP